MNLAKRFITGAFGRFTFSDLNSIMDGLEDCRRRLDALERQKRDRQSNGAPWFPAEITGNTLIPGFQNRWLYSWREVGWHPNDWEFDPLLRPVVPTRGRPGRPGTGPISPSVPPAQNPTELNSTVAGDPFALAAINGVEHKNTGGDGVAGNADGLIGPGVDIDAAAYVGCGLEPKPISNGVVVPMFTRHGILPLLQITGGRSPFVYLFALSNAHDKEAA